MENKSKETQTSKKTLTSLKSKRGGKRSGAGRPLGSGRYREPTSLIRVPNSLMPTVSDLLLSRIQETVIPLEGHLAESAKGKHIAISAHKTPSNDQEAALPLRYTFDHTISSVAHVADTRNAKPYEIPLYESRVAAGFPSPASEYEEGRIDLNTLLIRHPAATFLVRVQGESMIGAGIHPGDLLVVDRSLQAHHGLVIVAVVDGELTVKRLLKEKGQIILMPENPSFPPMPILENQDLMIWGVVTNVIHNLG